MNVELLFPPLYKMDAPYTALPYLVGYLRARGVEGVRATDLNIAYLHHLVDPPRLKAAAETLRARHAAFAGRPPPAPDDIERIERLQVSRAVEQVDWLIENLEPAMTLFAEHRDAARLARRDRRVVLDEQVRVQLAFDLLAEVYSACFAPWRIENLLTRREVHFSNDDWSGDAVKNIPWRAQMAALDDPRNPFLDWARAEVLPALERRAPAVVGLSLMFREQFLCVFTLAELVRRRLPEAHICIGGALLSDFEHYLYTCADLRDAVFARADTLVLGPGEVPFWRLLQALEAGRDPSGVPNVLTRATVEGPGPTHVVVPAGPDGRARRPGAVERFVPRASESAPDVALEVLANQTRFTPAGRDGADGAPHAAPVFFDDDPGRYLFREQQLTIPYLASHGCYWNKCTFCKYRDQVHRYSPVPLDALMADIERQCARFGSRRLHFNDEALSPAFCRRFSARILRDGVELRWSGNARFDPGLDRAVLAQVKASGCEYLSFGLESAAPAVLERTGKGTRVEVIERTMHDCRAVGLPVALYLFFGFPGETEADLALTLDFLRRHRGTYVDLSVGPFALYHSTEVFRAPARFGVRLADHDVHTPDVLRWMYDFEVLEPGALQPDEAARAYLLGHRAVFGELGPWFSTDGSL